jgi:hypothetical protein
MAKEQKSYMAMDFDDSESESFFSKPISSVIRKRRNISNKFAVLGWVLAFLVLASNFYSWLFPRTPTDLECARQLNTWCKLWIGKCDLVR